MVQMQESLQLAFMGSEFVFKDFGAVSGVLPGLGAEINLLFFQILASLDIAEVNTFLQIFFDFNVNEQLLFLTLLTKFSLEEVFFFMNHAVNSGVGSNSMVEVLFYLSCLEDLKEEL